MGLQLPPKERANAEQFFFENLATEPLLYELRNVSFLTVNFSMSSGLIR